MTEDEERCVVEMLRHARHGSQAERVTVEARARRAAEGEAEREAILARVATYGDRIRRADEVLALAARPSPAAGRAALGGLPDERFAAAIELAEEILGRERVRGFLRAWVVRPGRV